MSCSKPCEECVFIRGTDANCEPYNALKPTSAFWAGFHSIAITISTCRTQTHTKGKLAIRFRKMDVCSGWKREILKLKATGYFKTHRAIKRAYDEIGLGALETFASDVGKRERETARKTLRGVIKALAKERDRSESEVAHEIDPGQ